MHPRHLASAGCGPLALVVGAFVVAPSAAIAQPGPLPNASPSTLAADEPKPEGIAEAAPKASGLLATTPTLPPPRDHRKKFEVVTIDGYLRSRADWLKNLHLGFADIDDVGGSPYHRPSNCLQVAEGGPCSDSIKTANMRLRLEPTIQLSDTIAVHTQIDVFDNYVLGSLETSPDAPVARANRAWAEVSTSLGNLKFGRMPDHFGLGMVWNSGRRLDTDYAHWETLWQPSTLANIGGDNPVDYDLDADQGTTIDRFMFTGMIPGTPLRAAAAWDWGGQVSTTRYDSVQNIDTDDNDDINRWMVSIARIDAPRDFADRVARGQLGVNGAVRVQRTTTNWAYIAADPVTDPPVPVAIDQGSYLTSAWIKLGWKKLLVEAELALEVGSISDARPLGRDGELDIRTWGGVVRASGKAIDDKFGYGLEVGAASGDGAEADAQGRTHLRNISILPGPSADTITRFRFNPEYKVDLILFRELIGAVSNSAYFRPWLSYALTKSIAVRGQNVTALAINPVSTPGNSDFWGFELDADVSYRGNGFTAGLAYGGFFALAAMNHPSELLVDGSSTDQVFVNSTSGDNSGDATNAHTFQARFSVDF